MEKLQKIITQIQDIVEETSLNVSNEHILDNAVKIFISNSIQEQKNNQPKKSIYHEEPATDKQVNLIKKLNKGVVPAGISKREAMKLLNELTEKRDDKYKKT